MMNYKPSQPDYLYVAAQGLLFIIYFLPFELYTFKQHNWFYYGGILLVICGIIFGGTALYQIRRHLSPFPKPLQHAKLLQSGIYRISRHPIYTSILMLGFGYAMSRFSTYKLIVTILLMILFYFKSSFEEKLLTKKFPEYAEYQRNTRRFL